VVAANDPSELDASTPTGDALDALLREAAHVSETVASSRPALAAGSVLAGGRLSIVRKLGEGGMGVVYEAYDSERNARVALKTLSRVEAAGVYRLKNEFRGLSSVTHPNLVRLYELFVDGEIWFFTMELLRGQRFDRWVRPGGTLDEPRLRSALAQLVAGVDAIHAAGKLHRDLKPSNVLVSEDGRAVVLDFGLAVEPELGGVGRTVADESVSGTPAYMAPEQAAGRAATAASDYYAIGVMLFEGLTGRLPFQGRPHEMLTDKLRRAAPAVSESNSTAAPDLVQLCKQLLAQDAAARVDRAGLSAALHASIPGRIVAPERASASPPPGEPLLLGRGEELAALRAAFDASVAGKAVVVFVSGESGMGKSALVGAFASELRGRGVQVIAGRCYERENVPYKGFDALVDELSRHLRKLPGEEAAALLPRETYALARIFPVLERVPVVAAAPKREVSDPQDLKRRAFEAFGELLGRMRDRAPLVLVVDDLQWIDQDSLRFMRALLLHASPAPVLLVCAHRSEGAEGNALLSSVREAAFNNAAIEVRDLRAGPLAQAALAELSLRLLPPGAGATLAESFAREAQGSPFFAAELARSQSLRAAGAGPVSLDEALALHVGSLPEPARRLLALLALVGQPLAPLVACEAADVSDGPAQLDRLHAEQLVRASFDADGARMVECYHDKVREQIAASLDAPRTRALAQRLADVLLARQGSDPELTARALELAGLPEQAAEHGARAAQRAFSALAFSRAAALYTRALAHGRFEPRQLQALLAAKAEALAHAGQGERAAEAFVQAARGVEGPKAEELALRAGEQYLFCGELDKGRALLALLARGAGMWFPRTLVGALASLVWWRVRLRMSRLRFVPRDIRDARTERELEVLRTLAHGLVRTDQVRAAAFCARWVLRALRAGHAVELARALAWEFLFASMMDEPAHRRELVERLCERLVAETRDWFAGRSFVYARGVYSLMKAGNPAQALVEFDQAIAIVNAHPDPTASYDRVWLEYFRASALFMEGRVIDAFKLARSQLEDALARGDDTVSTVLACLVCWGWLAADQPAQAAEQLERARQRLRPGEETLQDMYWLVIQPLPDVYRELPVEAWRNAETHRARYLASLTGRYLSPGGLETMLCGVAVAAAQAAATQAERRQLGDMAESMERRARRSTFGFGTSLPRAALACLRRDREGAIGALRDGLQRKIPPLIDTVLRRRLGELLENAEGAVLIAEADAFLCERGVVHPARFVATLAAGIEISPASDGVAPG
jgi:eukaryotic-like serine/threonine-protein kinase